MYSATLRMISGTKAEAEVNAKSYLAKDKVFKNVALGKFVSGDGTIQVSVEDLEQEKVSFTKEMLHDVLSTYDSRGDLFYHLEDVAALLNQVLDIAYAQGVLSCVKDRVTFPFKEAG